MAMDLLWDTVNVNQNIVNLLSKRELRENNGKHLQRACHFSAALLQRFDLDYTLEGHTGCVNCLQWSADGRILASGSDDTHVRIWDPFSNKCLKVVQTKHIGNIFSVKFVGDASLIATGAGDCRVLVQCVEDSDRQPIFDCNCHMGRVKRLATAPDQPSLFWSAAEDGLIIQYDLREPHECSKSSTLFIDLNNLIEFKCITVNPTKPHLIAIGANDSYVRLYDRRYVKTFNLKSDEWYFRKGQDCLNPSCVQYYSPGHLAKDNGGDLSFRLSATYVTFDSTGNELLVNMGGEQIYIFNINNNRHINQLKIPECLPNIGKKSPVKPCCFMESDKSYKKIDHKHDYKLKSNNPCACDYTERATKLFSRQWCGDVYAAARDYLHVIQHWPENKKGYLGLIECLIHLKWADEASNWIQYFQQKFPSFVENKEIINVKFNLNNQVKINSQDNTDGIEIPDVTQEEKYLRLNSFDYESRYLGHCNTTTDIKEANFLGTDGNFICAGSDDGLIFIWDKKTTNLLTALKGDCSIVNCVQPHPTICYLASSGIDSGVKVWSPKSENQDLDVKQYLDPWRALEKNQHRMEMSPFETMLINMGYSANNPSPLGGVVAANCRTC